MGNSVMESDAASPEEGRGCICDVTSRVNHGRRAVIFFFFLQQEWEMDGTAARPSRTSARIPAVWAAEELFCCEGWNGLDRSAAQVSGIILSLSDASHYHPYDFACK